VSTAAALQNPEERDLAPFWRALEEVMDPEIPISLVDLGLIYDVRLASGVVEVDLTFTATACPCMAFIRQDIEERLLREDGVREVRINEVWNPPWSKSRISERGREQMRNMGVSV
jgi:metal-sulfur cluster biosynthetic enzyme